jgi:hypothetical protein
LQPTTTAISAICLRTTFDIVIDKIQAQKPVINTEPTSDGKFETHISMSGYMLRYIGNEKK